MPTYDELVASREARRNILIQVLIEKNTRELDKALDEEELVQHQRELTQKLLGTVQLITTPAGFRHVIRVEDRSKGSKPRQMAVHPLFALVWQTSGVIRLYYLGNGGKLYETAVYILSEGVDDDVVGTVVDEYTLHRMHPTNILKLIHELEDAI